MKIVLIFILIIGFFLRGQELVSGNFLFLKDQGRDLLAVRSVVEERKPTLIGPYTGLQAVFQGPLYYYLLAIPYVLFQGNPWGVMLLLMISSLMAIVIGYRIGGLTLAFLFATSSALSQAATFFWSPFFVIPIMSFYIYFLLAWLRTGKNVDFFWFSLSLSLLYHFELAFAVPWTIVTIIYLFLIKGFRFPWQILLGLIGFSVLPLIVFDLRHDFITSRSIMSLLTGSTQGLGSSLEPYDKILRDHVISFVSNLNAAFFEYPPLAGVVTLVMAIYGIWYIVFGKRREIKTFFLMPVILYAVYTLYPFQLYSWYLVGLFPIYMFLAFFILSRHRMLLMGVVILLSLCSLAKIHKLYSSSDTGGTAKIIGKRQALESIYNDANGAHYNLLIFTPVVLTDAYDYLSLWQYKFIPPKEKKGLTYLIIEPDPGKPWSHEGWLETVVHGGDIIDSWKLSSGFHIQKRIYD